MVYEKKKQLFSNENLKAMIVPLFLEQLLVMLVGMADTLIVSYAGEAAVSGVSLVNQFNTIFIYLFTALASGGAVVISQYIGKRAAESAGVAYPSLIARMFSAAVITWLCLRKNQEVVYQWKWIAHLNRSLMRRILNIAIPNGFENGVFQLVKVALSSIVALFGTYQIAANGVAQSIWSMAALTGVAMGPVFITVIGQCMGNGDWKAADYYFKKLLKITLLLSTGWNLLIFGATPVFLKLYALEPETKQLVIWLVLIHNAFNALAFPFSGALSNGLRAAGDVKFTMYVSILSTIFIRLLLSYVFGITMQMGVIGIALAMVCDWVIRAVIFFRRQKSGKWKQFRVV